MFKRSFLLVLYVALIGVLSSGSVFAQGLTKKYNHEVPLDTAKKYISNLNNDAMQMKTKAGMFYREGLDKILAQKGCIGVRFYYAKTDDGTPTLVGVGVDSTGGDMMKVLIEKILPCPPACASESVLIK